MSRASSDHEEAELVAIRHDEKQLILSGIEMMTRKSREASVQLETCQHRIVKVEAEEERYKREQQRAAELAKEKESDQPQQTEQKPIEKPNENPTENRRRGPKMVGSSAVGKRMFQGMVGILTKQKTQNTTSKVAERNKRLLEAEERAEEEQHKVTALSRQLELKALSTTKDSLTELIPKYNTQRSTLFETYSEMLLQEETFALTNFLLTQTKPAIYWKPAKQTASTSRIISNKRSVIADDYRKYRTKLDATLIDIRDSSLHSEDVPIIPRSTTLSQAAGKGALTPQKPSVEESKVSSPQKDDNTNNDTIEDDQQVKRHKPDSDVDNSNIENKEEDTNENREDNSNNKVDNSDGNSSEKMDES